MLCTPKSNIINGLMIRLCTIIFMISTSSSSILPNVYSFPLIIFLPSFIVILYKFVSISFLHLCKKCFILIKTEIVSGRGGGGGGGAKGAHAASLTNRL